MDEECGDETKGIGKENIWARGKEDIQKGKVRAKMKYQIEVFNTENLQLNIWNKRNDKNE